MWGLIRFTPGGVCLVRGADVARAALPDVPAQPINWMRVPSAGRVLWVPTPLELGLFLEEGAAMFGPRGGRSRAGA
eukprot:6239335-Lingulodinium_polyedra.AAC.1